MSTLSEGLPPSKLLGVVRGRRMISQTMEEDNKQEEVSAFAEYSDSPLHLVATDMDGTLLSPTAATEGHANGYLSQRTIDTARSLAAHQKYLSLS